MRAAVERDDLRDHGEAEPRPRVLRREERNEELCRRLVGHAGAVVLDGDPDEPGRFAFAAQRDASRARARRRGLARVLHEVHERAADESGVGERRGKRPDHLDHDARRQRTLLVGDLEREGAQVARPRLEPLGPAEEEKIARHARDVLGLRLDRLELAGPGSGILRLRGETRPAEDRSRRVPELVRDPRRHLAERRQLAAGRQLALEAPRRRPVLEEEENAQDRLRGIQDRDRRELDEAGVGPVSERELLRQRRRAGSSALRRLADRGHRVERGFRGRGAETLLGETEELAGRDVRLRQAACGVHDEEPAGMRPHESVGRDREDVGAPLFGAAEPFQLGGAFLQLLDRPLERRDRRLGFVAAGAHGRDEPAGPPRGLSERVDRLEETPQERHDEEDEDECGRGHRDREDAGVAPRFGDRRAVPDDPQHSGRVGKNNGDGGGSAVGRVDERLEGRQPSRRRHRHGREPRVRKEGRIGDAPTLRVVNRGAARVRVAEKARHERIRHERRLGIGCRAEAVREDAGLPRQAPQVFAHAPCHGVPEDDDRRPGEKEHRRETADDHVADLALERAIRHGRSLGIHGRPPATASQSERPATNAASAPHARNTPNGTSARARRTRSPAGVGSARAARTRKKSAPSSSARRPLAVRAPRRARVRASRTNARRRPAVGKSAVNRVPSAAAPGNFPEAGGGREDEAVLADQKSGSRGNRTGRGG